MSQGSHTQFRGYNTVVGVFSLSSDILQTLCKNKGKIKPKEKKKNNQKKKTHPDISTQRIWAKAEI